VIEIQATIETLVRWLQLLAESLAALVVGVGLVAMVSHAVRTWRAGRANLYWWTRVKLSQYLVLALEFQLAADILASSIAPSWAALGKLAIIAALRTGLNYFLQLEMKDMPTSANPASHPP
jgi:uncharacterized membrane protein